MRHFAVIAILAFSLPASAEDKPAPPAVEKAQQPPAVEEPARVLYVPTQLPINIKGDECSADALFIALLAHADQPTGMPDLDLPAAAAYPETCVVPTGSGPARVKAAREQAACEERNAAREAMRDQREAALKRLTEAVLVACAKATKAPK